MTTTDGWCTKRTFQAVHASTKPGSSGVMTSPATTSRSCWREEMAMVDVVLPESVYMGSTPVVKLSLLTCLTMRRPACSRPVIALATAAPVLGGRSAGEEAEQMQVRREPLGHAVGALAERHGVG